MKKILMGLLSLSTLVLAKVDVNKEPSEESTVFNNVGKIPVTVTFFTDPATPKYVIFAGPADAEPSLETGSEELIFPRFNMTLGKDGMPVSPKFESALSTVYTRKVSSDGSLQELTTEKIQYAIKPGYNDNYFNIGSTQGMPTTYFLQSQQLDDLAAALGMTRTPDRYEIADADGKGIAIPRWRVQHIGNDLIWSNSDVISSATKATITSAEITDPVKIAAWNKFFSKDVVTNTIIRVTITQ